MGLVDVLFSKRDKKLDWLELDATKWTELGTTKDGVVYSYDRASCYNSGNVIWWKQRAWVPGKLFEYSVCCIGFLPEGCIAIAVIRTLSDPGLKVLKKDRIKERLRPRTEPLIDQAGQRAKVWSGINGYQTPPPSAVYGAAIICS